MRCLVRNPKRRKELESPGLGEFRLPLTTWGKLRRPRCPPICEMGRRMATSGSTVRVCWDHVGNALGRLPGAVGTVGTGPCRAQAFTDLRALFLPLQETGPRFCQWSLRVLEQGNHTI